MSYEHKPDTGTAFPNDYKEDGDSKPDHKGQINLGGTMHDVAIWNSKTKDGKDYLYIKISDLYKS